MIDYEMTLKERDNIVSQVNERRKIIAVLC